MKRGPQEFECLVLRVLLAILKHVTWNIFANPFLKSDDKLIDKVNQYIKDWENKQ